MTRRLLIIEEQPVMRRGIEKVIDDAGLGVETKGVGSTGEALALLRDETWTAAMVDIGMSQNVGIGFLSRIAREHPNLPVLVFTLLPESPYGLRVLRAGATGFLHKHCTADTLAEALRRTLGGRRYVSPSLAEKLADRMVNDSDKAPHDLLSDREFEIFRQLALGRTIAEIAENLTISPKTVHAHRANILRKTGLGDNRALTSYAFEHRLIPNRRSGDRGSDDPAAPPEL